MKTNRNINKSAILIFFLSLFVSIQKVNAQTPTLPYVFENVSEYADNEIYIGLVGQYPNMGGVWMDMTTSQLQVMEYANNTIPGSTWANTPDGKNKYAAMFYKLSDIPNKTINIPHGLFGCRIFLSFKSPMYIYFHATGGYAGANLQNSSDPNDGIRWELVELTWGDAGLWTNTSRVDAYQYPMALEVTGYSGGMTGTYAQSYTAKINSGTATDIFKKIGELLPHQTIIDLWNTKVDQPFYGCKVVKTHSMDGKPIIEQPSKIPDFKDGAVYGNYFESYINDIWDTYRTQDLYLNIGDRGTWRGRITGDRFDFYDPADNSQATIYSKPTTTNAIEGSGSLATTPEPGGSTKYQEDLMIQAQVCAAINRHAIHTNTANGVVQYNHDASRFFTIAPYNQYVKFFHDEQISYQSQTYAFAYDDVGDHSSTIQCTFPTKVEVIIGGYGTDTNPVIQEPYTTNLIPSTIEAENYDKGGQGIAYSDASPSNEGSKYRTDAVDIEDCSEGGYNISHTADNEWLEYTVDVAQTGLYDFIFRTASLSASGKLRIEVDETVQSGSISLPITNDWQIWQSTTVQNVSLNKGNHIIRIYIEQGGFNFNSVSVSPSTNTGFLHADGKAIKNAAGANFLIKGIGTGNWMIQEGYMMQSTPIAPTQHQFRNKLIETIGKTKTNEFYELWLKNHFRKIDVDSMAAWGFNTVRVALHYIWFTPPIEDEPVPGQITWNNKGFEMIDNLLSLCSSNNMYLILDMHGAPGGQGKNADISDYNETKPSLWESELNKEKLVALWSKLAQRYKDEPWIGGYDLLNETNWDFENSGNQNGCACNSNTPLIEMHKRMIDAIRAVDKNHLVFVSGNCWGNNYRGMNNLFNYDTNMSITFHKYWNYNDAGSINDLLTLRETAKQTFVDE
ncbi:MAG: cellulase family glycosylhydrolase [Bacteroidales bacterium]|nr:cellulase family glycosylhydrolase [Bacteroidales bacterium]